MKTTIINSLLIGGSLLSGSLLTSASAAGSNPKEDKSQKKPNVLWIVADDLGADLGCYGTPAVKTPNLDRLAEQGVLFSNCFTVTAVCSPSRSALITGMYPVSIGCHQHRTHPDVKKALPEGVKPITHYFREAGYFTSNGTISNREKKGKEDYNFVADSIFDGTDWRQRKEGQPFFSQIQIFSPHRPFKRDIGNPVDPKAVQLPLDYPDHEIARKDWALYLENVQVVDHMVGEVLQRLKEEGLDENTVVFFMGDQGQPHVRAKQFLYDRGIHTPLLVRWPKEYGKQVRCDDLISNIDVSATSMHIAGIDIPKHIQGKSFLDENREKREFVYSMRDRRDETVDRIRSVRSKRFKYIRNFYPERPYTQFNTYKKTSYPVLTLMQVLHKQGKLKPVLESFMGQERPAEELYDLQADPAELHNLAEQKEYKGELEKMRKQLNKWMDRCDKGTYPEDQTQVDYWAKHARKAYLKKMKRYGLPADISDEEFLNWWDNYLDNQLKKTH